MNKLALVTGGAQRIGAAISRHLHRAGFDIALHYRHSEASAQRLMKELNEDRPDSCSLWQADLEDTGDIARLGRALLKQHPRLDVLVNNASGFEPTPLQDCTPEQFDALLGSNLKGPYFLTQALLGGLRAAGNGAIINIIDVHAERPLANFNAYVAAKAGLAGLTRSLALELGPDIRVNGIAPGAILWPEDDAAYDQQARERVLAATPLARMGDPSDIARTAVFLALEAPFITGQVIAVDGGWSLSI